MTKQDMQTSEQDRSLGHRQQRDTSVIQFLYQISKKKIVKKSPVRK